MRLKQQKQAAKAAICSRPRLGPSTNYLTTYRLFASTAPSAHSIPSGEKHGFSLITDHTVTQNLQLPSVTYSNVFDVDLTVRY